MKNDKEKFKKEFKARIYYFILRLVRFIGKLPKRYQLADFCQTTIKKRFKQKNLAKSQTFLVQVF